LPDTPTSPCGAPCSDIYTGGTRGDFVTVGPDGCLYATQSERVIKVTKADGTCSLTPTAPFPQIVLTPSIVSPDPAQGTTATLTANLTNVANPAGVPINFVIAGPNAGLQMVTTDAGGSAALTYEGALTGTDAVIASAEVNGVLLHSNRSEVTWTAGKHSTYLSLNASPSGGTVKAPLARTGTLIDVSATPPAPITGATIGFSLGGKTCTTTTDAKGTGSCSITPSVAAGSYPLTASFAGTGTFLPSSATREVDLFSRLFDAAKLWVGVEKLLDHATPFDIEVRVYNQISAPVSGDIARGLIRCVTGLKPSVTGAKSIIVDLGNAVSEPLAVRVFARAGTKSNGTACS